MNQVRRSNSIAVKNILKSLSTLAFVFFGVSSAFAQPAVLYTGLTSTTPSPSNSRFTLNAVGGFKQVRIQSNQTASASTVGWAFHSGTTGSPDYNPCWRPYTGSQTLSANIYIPTSFNNGAKYNTGGGGSDGLLPAITSGNYYTFNVSNNSGSDNTMQLLETSFNPVTISTVAATTPSNDKNSVLVTITTSGTPNASEYIYVRYSTDNFSSSTIAQAYISGTTATAIIPRFAGGTNVKYYVYTSNKTKAQIDGDVTSYGQSAHDMSTLNLNNNSGSNYSYTQGSGTNLGGVYRVSTSDYYTTLNSFVTDLNAGSITAAITAYVDAGFTETAPANTGYVINATGTASNTITLVKLNTAASTTRPILTANATLVGTNDAVIKLVGTDYMTIDGMDIRDNANTASADTTQSTNTKLEWGIALYAASTSNGCQNVTIQNCNIQLSSNYAGNAGIMFTNGFTSATTAANNAPASQTPVDGAENNNLKIYGNTISQVCQGVIGASSTYVGGALDETGLDIGGSSASTGNTITLSGRSFFTTLTPSNISNAVQGAINIRNHAGVNIRYNTISSNIIGASSSLTYNGICLGAGTAPSGGAFTNTISNNNVTLTGNGFASTINGIDFGYSVTTQNIVARSNKVTLTANSTGTLAQAVNGVKANYTTNTNLCRFDTVFINQLHNSTTTTTNSGALTGITTAASAVATNNADSNYVSITQLVQSSTTAVVPVISGAVIGVTAAGASPVISANANTVLVSQTGNPSGSAISSGATLSSAVTGVSTASAATGNNANNNTVTITQVAMPTGSNTGATTMGGGTIVGVTNSSTANPNATYNINYNRVTITQIDSTSSTGTLTNTIGAGSIQPVIATGASTTLATSNVYGDTVTLIRRVNHAAAGNTTTFSTGSFTGITATTAGYLVNIGNSTSGNPNIVQVRESTTATGTTNYPTAAQMWFINASAAHVTLNVQNNLLNTGSTPGTSTGSSLRSGSSSSTTGAVGIRTEGSTTVLTNNKNNTIAIDFLAASGSYIYGVYSSTSVTPVADTCSNNNITFTSLNGGVFAAGIQLNGGSSTLGVKSICNNSINITGSTTAGTGSATGISTGGHVGLSANNTFNGGWYGLKCLNNTVRIQVPAATIVGIDANNTNAGRAVYNANYISASSLATSSSIAVGIRGGVTGPYTISNNTIDTLMFSGGNSGTITTMYGIQLNAGADTVNNNNINIIRDTGAITGSVVHTLAGIAVTAGPSALIYSNTIGNISAGNGAGSTNNGSYNMSGVLVSAGGATSPYIRIYKNKIYGISNYFTSTNSGLVSGINVTNTTASTSHIIYNNLIGALTSPFQTNNNTSPATYMGIVGINLNASRTTAADSVYYNTVYLNHAASSGTNQSSAALACLGSGTATTSTLYLVNNNLINKGTAKGAGVATAVFRGASRGKSNFNAASNNNNYFGTNAILMDSAVGTLSTTYSGYLSTLGAAVGGRDSSSYNVDASGSFVSTVGSNANFLHLSGTTVLESAGKPVSNNITDDYDGHTRQSYTGYSQGGTRPDIGADEFAGTSSPCTAPTNTISTGSTSGVTQTSITGSFTAAGTQTGGIIVVRSTASTFGSLTLLNGTLYSVGSNTSIGTNAFVEYVGGPTSNGGWTSTGLIGGTTYYYYVVPFNFTGACTGPVYATTAYSLNATTSACATFNATINIDGNTAVAGVSYPTLTAAISAIAACGITQPTVLELASGYSSAAETYPIALTAITGQSATNTITIRPATGQTPTITSANTTATINISGGSYWVIDGRAGGTGSTVALTIANTSAATGGAAVQFTNDAQFDTIRYATLKAAFASTTAGIVQFSATATGNGNSYNTIANCNLDGGAGATASPTTGVAVNGIYSVGTSASILNTSNRILNNNFYDIWVTGAGTVTTAMNIGSNNTLWTITGNRIYQTATRTATTTGAIHRGIMISSGGGYTINNNVYGYANSSGTGTMTYNGTVATRLIGIDLTPTNLTLANDIQGNTFAGISLTTSSAATTTNGIFTGIYVQAGTNNIGTSSANTIGSGTGTGSITVSTSTTGSLALVNGIYVTSSNACVIQNNVIGSISGVSAAAGNQYQITGITTLGSGNVTVTGNTIGSTSTNNSITSGTSGVTTGQCNMYGVFTQNTGYTTTVTNNTVANATVYGSSTSNLLYAVYNTGALLAQSGNTLTMTGNNVYRDSIAAAGSSFYGVYNSTGSAFATYNVSSNNVYNNFSAATSSFYSIYAGGVTNATVTANSNNVYGNRITGAAATFYGVAAAACLTYSANSNNIYNDTLAGSSNTVYGIFGTTSQFTHNSNNIYNITINNTSGSSSSAIYGIYNLGSPTYEEIRNNNLYNLYISGANTGASTIAGILTNTTSTSSKFYTGNTIDTLVFTNSSTGTATVNGISSASGLNINISKNKIYYLTAQGAGSFVYGLNLSSGTNTFAYNNLIANLYTPSGTQTVPTPSIAGVFVGTGTYYNIYNNSVYMDASSSASPFGTAGVYASSTSPTTVNLRNNIFNNNSTSAGAGKTAAYQRISNVMTNYLASASNNNLYYGGSSNNIFYDGTTAYTSLSTFKAAVTPRDQNSQTEGTSFTSTDGSNSNFLNIGTSAFTYAESLGGSIPTNHGFTFNTSATWKTDYSGNLRQDTTGYSGYGTAPDAGARELNNPSTLVVISNNGGGQTIAANLKTDSINVVIHKAQLVAYYGNATTSAISFPLSGTYVAADVKRFRLYRTTTNTFDSSAGNLMGTVSTGLPSGSATLSFSSLSNNTFTKDTTYYLWLTVDINTNAFATVGNTIIVGAMSSSNATISTTGGAVSTASATTASGTQTIANPCAGTPASGSIVSSGLFTVCPASSVNNSVTFSLSGIAPATGISYQWRYDTDSLMSAPTNLGTNPTQATQTSSSTKYYYQCLVSCSNSGQTTPSAVRGINIYNTTLSIAKTNPGGTVDSAYCGYTNYPLQLTATTGGATADSITWSAITDLYRSYTAPANVTNAYATNVPATTVYATPSAGRTYTATARYSSIGCSNTSASKVVTVGSKVTVNTVAASNNPVCAGSSSSLSMTTSVNPTNTYVETFDGTINWSLQNFGSGNNWTSIANAPGNAINCIWHGTNPSNAWATSTGVTLTAGTPYTLKFYYKVGGSFNERLKVHVMSSNVTVAADTANKVAKLWDNGDTSGTVSGASFATPTSYTKTTAKVFTPGSTGTYYFSFHANSIANQNTVFIDSVALTTPNTVAYTWTPSSNLSSGTGSPVTFTMPNSSPASSYTYTVRGAESGGCYKDSSVTINLSNSAPTLNSSTLTTRKKVGTTYTPISGATSGSAATLCSTDTVVVRSPGIIGGCAPYTYTWYNLNGDLLYTTTVDSIKYVASTNCAFGATDAYQLTVTDAQTQVVSSNLFYYSIVDNSFSVTPSSGLVCNYNIATTTDSVKFGVTATNLGTITWSPTTSLRTKTDSAFAYPSATTTYGVTNTFSGCTTAATSVVVTVGVNPTITSISSSSPSVCSGNTFSLSSSATGGAVFSAQFTDGFETFPSSNFSAGSSITASSYTGFAPVGSKAVNLNIASSSITSNNAYTLASNMNLTSYDTAYLTFKHVCAMEYATTPSYYDVGFVEYSTNGGTTWITFPTSTYRGNANQAVFTGGANRFSTASYTAWTSVSNAANFTPTSTAMWQTDTFGIPASALTNQFRVRFRMTTDISTQWNGWYIDDINIYGRSQTSISGYSWTSNPTGFTSSAQNPTGVGLQGAPVATRYIVTATNSFGCTKKDSVLVGLGGGTPAVTISRPVGTDSGCYNRNVTLKANITGGCSPFTYKWFVNGNQISTGGRYTIAGDSLKITGIQIADTGYYSVRVIDQQPDSATSASMYIHVYVPGVVTITPSQTALCGQQIARMIATGGKSGATYTWSPTTELFSNSTAGTAYTGTNRDSVWAKISANRTYTVTTQDNNNCSITASQTINYLSNNNISVSASAASSNLCAGTSTTFTGTGSMSSYGSIKITEATTYLTSAGAQATYPSYMTAATSGTTNDFVELSNLATTSVDISGLTIADWGSGATTATRTYTFPTGTIVPGNKTVIIHFGTGTNNTDSLYFNAGGTSDTWSSSSAVGFVLKSGTTVIDAVALNSSAWSTQSGVTASDWSGNIASSSSTAGVIRTVATDNNTASDWTVAAASTNVTRYGTYWTGYTTISNPSPSFTYAWTPASNLSSSTISGPTFSMPASGASSSYSYTVTATETNTGCIAISSPLVITLSSGAPVISSVTASQNSVCYTTGGSTVLTATISGGCAPYNYRWKIQGAGSYLDSAIGTSSLNDTFRVQPTATTVYQVDITDNSGATATGTNTITLTINNPTPVSATGTTVCNSGIPTVTATANSGNTIAWFDASTGGNFLAYGSSYSPSSAISSTTTYYAGEAVGTPSSESGLGKDATGIPETAGASAERGIVFRATKNFRLSSAQYYSTVTGTSGSVTVRLYDSTTGTQLATTTLSMTHGGSSAWYTMDLTGLNYTCVSGTAYRLTASFSTISVSRYATGVNYASSTWNNLGTFGVIRTGWSGSAVDGTIYSYFHNISAFEIACSGATRLAATATVNTPTVVTLSNNSQVGTQQLAVNTTNNIISRGTLAVANTAITLSSATVTLNGTYRANEIASGGIKLWYNTTNTLTGATQLGSGQTSSRSSSAAETFTFSSLAQSLPIGTYYFWVTASISSGANTDSTITVNSIGSGNFSFSGCFGSTTGTVSASGTSTIVNPCTGTPNAVTFAGGTSYTNCSGTTPPTITGTNNNGTTTAGYTYKWFSCDDNSGTNPVEIAGQTLINYTPATYTTAGTRYYFNRVYCSFSGDSATSAVVSIAVTLTPTVSLGASPSSTVCGGTTVTITDANYVSGYTYNNWTPNVSSTQTAIVTPTSTTTYSATATNGSCTSAPGTITITVTPTPSAVTAASSAAAVCNGSTVNLTATGGLTTVTSLSDGFETFPSSNFSANGSGITAAQNNTYYSHGSNSVQLTYTASLTTSSTNNSYQLGSNIDLTGLDSAKLTFNHIGAFENNLDYGYVQYSTNGGSTWTSFPTSSYQSSATLSNSVVSFTRNAYSDWTSTFTSSTATPGTGPATSLWKAESIKIPSAALTSNQFRIRFLIASDGSVQYYGWLLDNIAITKYGGATYAWTSNPAGYTSSSQNPTNVTVSATTRYIVTASNSYGCTAKDSVLVTANPLPAAPTATSDGTSTCGTPTFTVSTNTGASGRSFAWYNVATGGTAISGQTDSSYVPGSYTIGNDTVWTSEVSAAGCYSTRTRNIITVSAADPHNAAANSVTTCVGTATMLRVSAGTQANFSTYKWLPVDSLFTDAACTTPYVLNDNQDTVYAKSSVAKFITYTVVASNQTSGNPACSNSDTVRVTYQAPIVITAQPAAYTQCGSVTRKIGVAAYNTGTKTYQWQSSTDSTSWSNVANGTPTGVTYSGATSDSLQITSLSRAYYYRVVVSDGVCSSVNSNATLITAGTPTIATYAGASTCTPGSSSLTLGATASNGSVAAGVRWYATNVSTTVLKDSAFYVTPAISSTTTYYAEPYIQLPAETGLGKDATGIPETTGASAERGIVFRANKNFSLTSAQYYSTITNTNGSVTIRLVDSASGTQLATTTLSMSHGSSSAWYTMDLSGLNYTCVAGTSYRLLAAFTTISVSRYATGVNYASSTWNNLGTLGVIRTGYDGGVSSTIYSYFHNITARESACTGTRQAVTATITTAPSITVGSNATICSGGNASLSVSSSNAGYKYTWTNNSNAIDTLIGASQSVSPSATAVYALSATDTTTGNTFSGCTNTGSLVVIVGNTPTALTLSAAPTQLCGGGVTTLSASGGSTTGQSVLVEPSEVASPLFATATASGVTAALNGTYYTQGSKSLRLSYTNNLSSGASDSLSKNIDLTKLTAATITFKQICATEAGADYGYVQYSTDAGATWTSFPSTSYSGSGTLKNSVVSFDASSYSDWNSQFTSASSLPTTGSGLWKTETITVPSAALTSTQFRIRFRITSNNNNVQYYGWLIDDVQVTGTAKKTYAWTSNPSGYTSAAASPTPSPTVSTDYSLTLTSSYGCGVSSTTPASVTYLSASVQGTATATASTICNGNSTQDTLTQTGGSLGAGAYWAWYTNATFGSSFLVDTTTRADGRIIVSPTATTTYYLRAEGASLCATTGGSSVTITVNQPSVAPTSASASATTICAATNITLTQTGGTLGTNASWKWYSDNTFSTLVGTSTQANASLVVNNVNATTTFYVRAEGTSSPCTATTAAASVTVTKQSAITATISGDTLICGGSSRNLTVNITGSSPWTVVYSNGSSNTTVSNVTSSPLTISVSPTASTVYTLVSVAGAGSCNASVSGSATVNVIPAAPSGYSHNWRGGTSSDWSVASNWCSNTAPIVSNSAYIGNSSHIANQPALSASSSISKVQLAGGATLTIGSGLTLTAYDNVFKYGDFAGAGTLEMQSAGSMTTLSGTGALPSNLKISNIFFVQMGSSSTVSGDLNMNGGFLDVNGNTLTLNGTVSGSTTILATTTGSVVVLGGPSTVPTNLGSTVAGLTINRAGGVAMSGNLTVSEALTQTSGKFSIAGYTLTLGGTISNSASNSLTGSNTSKLVVTTGTGTAYFDQTTSSDVYTTDGSNALWNITKSGSGTFTIGNKLNVFNQLSSTGGTINLNGNVVLRSTAANTAFVSPVSGTITGQVTVERYMHKQLRGWRSITAPITFNGLTLDSTTNSVKANWQNSWGYDSGYGTKITGPIYGLSYAGGLDDSTIGYSMQKFNSATNSWDRIKNTWTETITGTAPSAANKAFWLFVRGDRRVNPNGTSPLDFKATTLAAKGLLQTGTQVFNYSGVTNRSWLVGNPYACAVDMSQVTLNNMQGYVYFWDPNLAGSNAATTGNYCTFDASNWNIAPTAGNSTKYFQSGQAFFVKSNATTGSVTFTESAKVTDTSWNGQTTRTGNGVTDYFNVKLSSVRADGTKSEVDGVRAKYAANYDAAVDAMDATKFPASGIEQFSLARSGKTLSIEARPYIVTTDTLYFNLTSMATGANYEFKFNPIDFDPAVTSCKLIDNFLNTETPISLTANTTIGFSVTSVTGSNAANRFKVVFNASGSLPINTLNVKAYKQNNNVVIDWEAIAENNMKSYDVEKSANSVSFTKLGDAAAKNGSATNKYTLVDTKPVMGTNYYRIKSIQANSNTAFSAIVRVEMTDKGIASVTVYPNPVKVGSNTIGLQMTNLSAGNYNVKMYNAAGVEVWNNKLQHNGNNGTTILKLNSALSSGTYQLQLVDEKGTAYTQSIIVAE